MTAITIGCTATDSPPLCGYKPARESERYMPESTKSSAEIISERYDDKLYA